MLAVGQVVEVSIPVNREGVIVTVDLVEHTREFEPVRADCVVGQAPGGSGFGRAWVPRVGTHLLCAFPGVGPEGDVGDDLERGVVISQLPGLDALVPTDDQGSGPATDRTVTRAPTEEASSYYWPGAASAVRAVLDGLFTWIVKGVASLTFQSSVTVLTQSTVTITAQDLLTINASGDVLLDAGSNAVTVDSGDVRLGSGTRLKLLNSLAADVFNTHVHPKGSGPTTLFPGTFMTATEQTSETEAS